MLFEGVQRTVRRGVNFSPTHDSSTRRKLLVVAFGGGHGRSHGRTSFNSGSGLADLVPFGIRFFECRAATYRARRGELIASSTFNEHAFGSNGVCCERSNPPTPIGLHHHGTRNFSTSMEPRGRPVCLRHPARRQEARRLRGRRFLDDGEHYAGTCSAGGVGAHRRGGLRCPRCDACVAGGVMRIP